MWLFEFKRRKIMFWAVIWCVVFKNQTSSSEGNSPFRFTFSKTYWAPVYIGSFKERSLFYPVIWTCLRWAHVFFEHWTPIFISIETEKPSLVWTFTIFPKIYRAVSQCLILGLSRLVILSSLLSSRNRFQSFRPIWMHDRLVTVCMYWATGVW